MTPEEKPAMKMNPRTPGAAADLRARAEAQLLGQGNGSETDADPQRLLHELEVHQIELEMQNEQLREVAGKLEAALERHNEFYEFAPVGYLSLQPDSTIRQVNLTAVGMLGQDRSALLNRRLAVFVSVADRLAFRDWLYQVFAGRDPEASEVSLLLKGKPPLAVELRACLSVDGQECRVVLTDLTARRQAEAARRESEARFRALLDRAPDGILLLSPGGNLISLNEAFARMHGYSVAEMLQMNLRDLDTPETQQLLPERMRRLLAGEALTFEVEHYHRDGRIVPLEVSAIQIKHGGETYIQAIHRDITERRQMEAMFQARLRLSEYAHNHTLDELLTRTLDEAELLTGSARGCFQFVAADQKTLCRQTWSTRARQQLVTAAGQERPAPGGATKLWREAVRERRPLIHVADAERSPQPGMPAASGRALPESANLEPQAAIPQRELVVPVIQGGRVVALLGVADKPRDYLTTDIESVAQLARLAWDIVLVKQAEEALRERESMLKRTESIAHVGSWEWEVANDTVRWSDELFRIFQRHPAQGPPSFAEQSALYHPEDWQHLQRAVAAARSAGTGYELELRALRKDGETRVCLARGHAEKEPGKTATRLFGSLQDITERKQLAERVRRVQKMEAISSIAGGIAHEFNNILGALLMSVGMIKLTTGEPKARELLEGMEKLSERAANLVNQLLAFSRQSILRRRPVDLAALLAQQSKLMGRMCGERITIEYAPPPDLAWAEADSGALQQIVLNLCLNAREAMKNGGTLRLHLATVEVRPETAAAHPEVQPGTFVCLSVADTGCGMSPQIMQRVFEPFFTTKDVGQGPGLSLAAVRGLVEQHRGFVTVESQVGQGSTFRVYLPTCAPPVAVAPEAKPVRGQGTILLVEDEPALLKVEQTYLALKGYKVLAATNAQEALDLWAEHRGDIDLLYTDVVMPGGLNGHELAERLLADEPELPVIITSGYNTVELEAGKTGSPIVYVAKPCLPSKLTLLIRDALARRKAAPEPALIPQSDRS